MRDKRLFVILMVFGIFFTTAVAHLKAEETATLPLGEAVKIALADNPEILAAKNNYKSARARVPQELLPEDPMVEYMYDEMRAGVPDLVGKPMRSYAISQKMPFPSKLILRSQIASKDARILYESYKEKEKDVIARVKSSYSVLWYIEKALDVAAENEALLEQFATSAASRYAVAKGTQQDALKAQVELAKIKNQIVLYNEKRDIAQADLNILLNRDPRSSIVINKDLKTSLIDKTLDELSETAKENRPKLRAFRYAVEKGRAEYMLAWNEFLPDFSARYEQMIMDGSGGKWKGMLGMTVPIWFWAKQASGVSEMKSELAMFRADYDTMENMTLFDVRQAYTRVMSHKKLVETYETSFVPQAEQALKASLTGYEAGEVDFLNLLDSERMLLDIKTDYYRMVSDLEIAKAQLEKAVGTDLY
jgi:outer membrane protein, heavy metal efflux system